MRCPAANDRPGLNAMYCTGMKIRAKTDSMRMALPYARVLQDLADFRFAMIRFNPVRDCYFRPQGHCGIPSFFPLRIHRLNTIPLPRR